MQTHRTVAGSGQYRQAAGQRRWHGSGKIFIAAGAALLPSVPAGATILADSRADWDAARTNGLGVINGVDTPEQGHPDMAGSGRWFYQGPFSDLSNPVNLVWDAGLQVYDRGTSPGFDLPFVGRDTAHGEFSSGAHGMRTWETSLPAGTPVRIQGVVELIGGPGSTGIDFLLVINDAIRDPLVYEIIQFGEPFEYDVTTTLWDRGADNNSIYFAIGTAGYDANFDTTYITATISAVPEPAGFALLALGGGVLGLLRRRRR